MPDQDPLPDKPLTFTLVQPDMLWEDKEGNLQHYERLLQGRALAGQVVVLPEMFSTGFSMQPEKLAENMDGQSIRWMRDFAGRHKCILAGSLIIEEGGNYYNRLVWMQPDGNYGSYDKRHLFAYAGEDAHYTAGQKRTIARVNGWRVCLQVCYDLRFPVWARNSGEEYDVLLYVANWPERRALAWKTLLQARAIENLSYVVGVNRVGTDGKDIRYQGESSVFGPTGELLWQQPEQETVHTLSLDPLALRQTREHFPFLNDADKFILL